MGEQQAYQALTSLLGDRTYRLNNLYAIKNEHGEKTQFQMNWAQADFYSNIWYFNVILKARQLGFTTFILLYFLDACLFNRDHAAGVIAHTREDAEDLFKNKVKFAYDNLPDWLRAELPATQDSARKLEFANGSSITVGTSLRSGTYQKLLVSEYGKISARYPEKAKEIKTGALNTVHAGQQIFVESTAEGQHGEFFDLTEIARKLEDAGKVLTPLDPKFHFYPWYRHPGYVLESENISVDLETQDYFAKLAARGVSLKPSQKAWYVKKAAIQQELMRREFPSFPEEAFESSLEGAFYTKEMALVRRNKQICYVPWEPSQPVYTFWDIGLNDHMAIWFFQHIGNQYRFIRYFEATNEGWGFYANYLKSLGYSYEAHYWPHDGNKRILGAEVVTSKQSAQALGIAPIKIVERTNDVIADVRNFCKPALIRSWFDEQNCAVGIRHLDSYRKEWDERLGTWKEKPRHDDSSDCADAFRTFAMGYTGRRNEFHKFSDEFADMEYDYFK